MPPSAARRVREPPPGPAADLRRRATKCLRRRLPAPDLSGTTAEFSECRASASSARSPEPTRRLLQHRRVAERRRSRGSGTRRICERVAMVTFLAERDRRPPTWTSTRCPLTLGSAPSSTRTRRLTSALLPSRSAARLFLPFQAVRSALARLFTLGTATCAARFSVFNSVPLD